jgi:uncharacterized protein YbaR (Trm112 family)
MINPTDLKRLCCPIDPKRQAALTQPDETKLLCECCQVQFPIRDGFPILLVDEAVLPAQSPTLQQLPCQGSSHKPS